jgi:hypothetical protein
MIVPLIFVSQSLDGCIQHGIDQFRIWFRSDRPADDQTIDAVYDGAEIHLASRDTEFNNAGQRFLVWGCSLEVAFNEVLGCQTDFSQIGAVSPPLWRGNDQVLLFHQPLHNLL